MCARPFQLLNQHATPQIYPWGSSCGGQVVGCACVLSPCRSRCASAAPRAPATIMGLSLTDPCGAILRPCFPAIFAIAATPMKTPTNSASTAVVAQLSHSSGGGGAGTHGGVGGGASGGGGGGGGGGVTVTVSAGSVGAGTGTRESCSRRLTPLAAGARGSGLAAPRAPAGP